MNEPQKFSIFGSGRTTSAEIIQSKEEIRINLTCTVPGPIPQTKQFDSFLDECVAPFEEDSRRLVLAYEGRAAVLRTQGDGGTLIAFGKLKTEGNES